jgi:ATP-binding cassette subfamily B protein
MGQRPVAALFAAPAARREKRFHMQDRLPQSRSDAVLQARTGHLSVLRELLPYVWPADRPDLRWRVVFALAALVVSKAITLVVPIAYKAIIDLLTGQASTGEVAGLSALGFAAVPAMLIVAYGVGRVLMVLFAQFRDVWFTVVAQNAVRQLAKKPSAICMRCRCGSTWNAAPAASAG